MKMPGRGPLLLAAALSVSACKKSEVSSGSVDQTSLGAQAAAITNDTRTLASVQAATGDVIRNAADCDKVRELTPEALRAITEADGKLQTATGRATLEGLKTRLKTSIDACP